ncbi:hypothetical protein GN958_ATG06641 [Phytophthora infestans]|uniref:Uncharacterized protein n=1 Tax=Phytophthora infestans TaxID=4787 RepID=A0A8S9UWR7_PHYIN|nr:hypothetical protein GN958_ATG06641 [Phytophthora infestans]
MHRSCLAAMLTAFGAEESFDSSVCGKRCHNAVVKARRLDQSSKKRKQLQPLHRRRGQSGETKQTLATEAVDAIVDSGVSTVRTPKHVMNKILGLETSFRLASDWLANTNQGVGSERDLRAIILQRCPSSYELQPVMDDNPSTHPLLLNTQEGFTYSDRDSDSSSSEEVKKLIIQSEELTLRKQRVMKVEEAEARIAESNAHAQKLREEAEHWRIQRLVTLLRERTKLKQEGVSQEDIDLALPLPMAAIHEARVSTLGADSVALLRQMR